MTMFPRLPVTALVAIGAAIGAGARWGLAELIEPGWLPWPTLAANLIGSALLGYLVGRTIKIAAPAWATAGICGSLTTMSSFAVEMAELLDSAFYYRAAIYLLLTTSLGIASYRIAST